MFFAIVTEITFFPSPPKKAEQTFPSQKLKKSPLAASMRVVD